MTPPLLFLGAVIVGFGVLELTIAPLICRMTGLDDSMRKLFVRTGATAVVLGLGLVAAAMFFGPR